MVATPRTRVDIAYLLEIRVGRWICLVELERMEGVYGEREMKSAQGTGK